MYYLFLFYTLTLQSSTLGGVQNDSTATSPLCRMTNWNGLAVVCVCVCVNLIFPLTIALLARQTTFSFHEFADNLKLNTVVRELSLCAKLGLMKEQIY